MKEAIVIGAGMGGLSAAISLASHGQKVTVFEALDRPGGKVFESTYQGVSFDTGPSVLTMPDVLESLFNMAGTTLDAELELVRPTPAFRYHWEDGAILDISHDLEETLAEISRVFGPKHEEELRDFMTYTRKIWDAAAPHFVYGDAPSLGGVMKMGMAKLATFRHIDPMNTMWQAITKRISSAHLRMLLARYATYNGSDPRKAPATLNCIAHVELARGCLGIKGGMYALTSALLRIAQRLNVTLHTGAPVAKIQLDERKKVQGVVVNGRFHRADIIVSNADVAHLADLLPQPVKDVDPGYEPSMSGWTAVYQARRLDGRAAHAVLFCQDYMQEFEDIFDRDRPPVSPTVYVCAQERAHGRSGWENEEPLFVMANAPPTPRPGYGTTHTEEWQELAETVHRRLVDAKLISPADNAVWTRTPGDLADSFPGSRGSIYGPSSNSRFSAFQRVSNRINSVTGLYVASGSAHPGGGVPLCLLSGMAAARAARQDLGCKSTAA